MAQGNLCPIEREGQSPLAGSARHGPNTTRQAAVLLAVKRPAPLKGLLRGLVEAPPIGPLSVGADAKAGIYITGSGGSITDVGARFEGEAGLQIAGTGEPTNGASAPLGEYTVSFVQALTAPSSTP